MKKNIVLYVALLLSLCACEPNGADNRLPEEIVPLSDNAGDAVDLGLSVLWADRNLEGHYAWGEVETKSYYSEDNYHAPFEITAKSYNNISGSKYDAARMNWGGKWRMPTYKEFVEFSSKCTFVWNGHGYNVTGPNGNTMTLPTSDNYMQIEDVKYWTASVDQGEWMAPLYWTVWSVITPRPGSICPGFGYLASCIRPVRNK